MTSERVMAREAEEEGRHGQSDVFFLERRKYLSKYESCVGMLPVEIWRTTVHGRGNGKCKGPEVGAQLGP